MDAALMIAVLTYTAAVVLICRSRWAHRCAECAWRHRRTHTTGRHRANRMSLPAPPTDADTLRPAAGDPDATSPMLPSPPRPCPNPYPRALPTGRR